MIMSLYTKNKISGSCLNFIHILNKVSSLSQKECLKIGEKLYDFQYTIDNPIQIELINEIAFNKLKNFCLDYGILFDSK